MDDIEQCQREAGLFMEQEDEEILVSDRPQRVDNLVTSRSQADGKSYILERFISDQRGASPGRNTTKSTIRSMQHFFLKVGREGGSCYR